MGTEKKDHVLCILFALLFAGGFLLCLFWLRFCFFPLPPYVSFFVCAGWREEAVGAGGNILPL